MATISKIWAREILDSRGIPTVEAACQLTNGMISVASVPAGTSTGTHEALELRDIKNTRYRGKGVLTAVKNVNDILGPGVSGLDPIHLYEIDAKLIEIDGTENKSKYGANAILAVSMAVTKVGALAQSIPPYRWIEYLAKGVGVNPIVHIPTPLFNMVNGGLHGAGNLDFQEFHVSPASSKSFSQPLMILT